MSTFFGHRCVNLLCEVQFSTFNKCVLHAGGSLSEYVVYDGSGLCKRRTIWLDRQKQRFLVPMQVNYFIYLFVLILHADLLILPFLKHSFASRFRRRWTQTFSKLYRQGCCYCVHPTWNNFGTFQKRNSKVSRAVFASHYVRDLRLNCFEAKWGPTK